QGECRNKRRHRQPTTIKPYVCSHLKMDPRRTRCVCNGFIVARKLLVTAGRLQFASRTSICGSRNDSLSATGRVLGLVQSPDFRRGNLASGLFSSFSNSLMKSLARTSFFKRLPAGV